MEWQAVKDKLLKLAIAERREFYFCGEGFIKLADIPNWPDYFKLHQKFKPEFPLLELSTAQFKGKFKINEDLNKKVSIWQGDITKLEIDGIVNAANESLLGGGGVDGCIHKAAGGLLFEECRTLDGCDTGISKTTCGYHLPAKYVIHTVGPRGIKPDLLASCYQTAFDEALRFGIRSIAFPCISTGIFGYPSEQAAHVALYETRNFLQDNHDKIDRIIFATFLDKDVKVYQEYMQHYFPVTQANTTAEEVSKSKPLETESKDEAKSEQKNDSKGSVEMNTDSTDKTKPDEEINAKV